MVRTHLASVAFGFMLSLPFRLIWDVGILSGFLIWSTSSGGAGALIAVALKRGLMPAPTREHAMNVIPRLLIDT